jgi:hypothetical protein
LQLIQQLLKAGIHSYVLHTSSPATAPVITQCPRLRELLHQPDWTDMRQTHALPGPNFRATLSDVAGAYLSAYRVSITRYTVNAA